MTTVIFLNQSKRKINGRGPACTSVERAVLNKEIIGINTEFGKSRSNIFCKTPVDHCLASIEQSRSSKRVNTPSKSRNASHVRRPLL
jgi:hypothetical protein